MEKSGEISERCLPVCSCVPFYLSFFPLPLFLRANRRGTQSSSCKFSKGGERRKEGRVKRREDDREGGIHPDYANKRNGFHIWSFNEAKTIAGEEEEEEKKNVNGLHRIFKRPLLSFVLSSFSSVQLFLDSSRDHSFQVVSHTFLLSSFLSPSSFRNNPLHLPLRFYPISPPLRKISPRNVNFCLVD